MVRRAGSKSCLFFPMVDEVVLVFCCVLGSIRFFFLRALQDDKTQLYYSIFPDPLLLIGAPGLATCPVGILTIK
jgi:hypothetical protein